MSDTPTIAITDCDFPDNDLERVRPGNDAIARDFLHRDGPLFDETLSPARRWSADNPDMARDVEGYFLEVNSLQTALLEERGEVVRAKMAPKGAGGLRARRAASASPDDVRRAVGVLADFFCERQVAIEMGRDVAVLPKRNVREAVLHMLGGGGAAGAHAVLDGHWALPASLRS